jgi:hypothetical protein
VQQYVNQLILRLPHWLRWVLILPTAFLADLVAQVIYRLLFWLVPFSFIRPYTDELAWRFFAPLIFVVAGTKMAPRHWLIVACVLIGFKAAIALVNIITLLNYLDKGGNVSSPAPITNAPVWWSLLVQALFIALGVFIAVADRNIRKKPTDSQPVLDF